MHIRDLYAGNVVSVCQSSLALVTERMLFCKPGANKVGLRIRHVWDTQRGMNRPMHLFQSLFGLVLYVCLLAAFRVLKTVLWAYCLTVFIIWQDSLLPSWCILFLIVISSWFDVHVLWEAYSGRKGLCPSYFRRFLCSLLQMWLFRSRKWANAIIQTANTSARVPEGM